MDAQFVQSKVIWRPKNPARERMDSFRRIVNRTRGLNLSTHLPYFVSAQIMTATAYKKRISMICTDTLSRTIVSGRTSGHTLG